MDRALVAAVLLWAVASVSGDLAARRGYIHDNQVRSDDSEFPVRSVLDCGRQCEMHATCSGFSHSTILTTCQLHTQNNTGDITTPRNTMVYYARSVVSTAPSTTATLPPTTTTTTLPPTTTTTTTLLPTTTITTLAPTTTTILPPTTTTTLPSTTTTTLSPTTTTTTLPPTTTTTLPSTTTTTTLPSTTTTTTLPTTTTTTLPPTTTTTTLPPTTTTTTLPPTTTSTLPQTTTTSTLPPTTTTTTLPPTTTTTTLPPTTTTTTLPPTTTTSTLPPTTTTLPPTTTTTLPPTTTTTTAQPTTTTSTTEPPLPTTEPLLTTVSTSTPATTISVPLECPYENTQTTMQFPDGITYSIVVRYSVSDTRAASVAHCSNMGSYDLARIDSAAKQNHIYRILTSCGSFGTVSYWIDGAKNGVDQTWKFSDQSEMPMDDSAYWSPGQPSNVAADECVIMRQSAGFRWENTQCGSQHSVICLKPV